MKRVLVLLLTVLSCCAGRAQSHDDDKDKSLLWRISGNGLARSSFLFGTIHLICPDDLLWTPNMERSLNYVNKVCFEMDLDDHDVMSVASQGLMDTSGKQLKDYFTDAQYEQLKKFVKSNLHMSVSVFSQMRPIALQSMISMKATDCNDPISYEERIMKETIEMQKEIIGLEDPREQIDVLSSVPVDTVVKEMMEEINNFKQSQKDYAQLIDAYKNQDLPKLYELITKSKELGADMNAFLDDRNKRWIPRMEKHMQHYSVFYAVGAGHLYGDNGVINLLRKQGYRVEPLNEHAPPRPKRG